MKYTADLSLFHRNRNFTLLYVGQFISWIGSVITSVALPYQIYHLTQSTLMVGLLSLVQLLPLIFTALIGGVFADRYHRRQLLIVTECVMVLGALCLTWNAHQASPHIIFLFIVASLMSAFNGLHRPALDSLAQQVVDRKDYMTLAALGSFKRNMCLVVAPAIAGLVISFYGLTVTFLLDVLTFVVSLTALLMMSHIPKPPHTQDESTWDALKSGCRYAFSRQELVGSYLVDFNAMVFGMPNALFPAIAQSFGGAKVLGLLYSAPALGAVVVSCFSGFFASYPYHGRAIAYAAALWGISIIFFGFSANLFVALFFLWLAGAFDGISGIYRGTMWNETIPQHLRGRLAGIEMISYLSGPRLGDTESGFVASLFGVTTSVVSGGVLCVISVAACCYYLPVFWRYRANERVAD